MTIPPLGPNAPSRGGPVSRAVGRAVLSLLGWRIEGRIPDVAQCVTIAAPHTSNWDFVVGIAAMLALGVRVQWLGKHTLFRRPFFGLMSWLGGLPVDRAAADGVVDSAVARFRAGERLFLGMTPEGTRRKVERWKSGFHRIALSAGVPIFPVAIDWGARTLRLDPLVEASPDLEADVARLRSRYSASMARRPESF